MGPSSYQLYHSQKTDPDTVHPSYLECLHFACIHLARSFCIYISIYRYIYLFLLFLVVLGSNPGQACYAHI
jgi:hypothetical protein